ncbi:hypothetical protein PP339_gp007 [Mycobacterium phage Onyinye]|uniref:Uncharacterized protein n=1 Tax=Mycobacterium phage Onyinye TaxID=2686235 RepID=A0A6B9LHV1_9CAUD|nr:hypothetical protein PP339_gp007 [Mycobacterium phage Onyinye]QHB37414.1 hypothetical protein SEA_ONYINYE_7 [Mycobacterium phage Onyinye]
MVAQWIRAPVPKSASTPKSRLAGVFCATAQLSATPVIVAAKTVALQTKPVGRPTVPKRKVRSAAQIAAQRKASQASARKRAVGRVISFPAPTGKASGYTKPGTGGRRTKLGGKAYTKKSGSGVTIAPAVQQVLNGEKVTASLTDFHPDAVRGEGVVQTGGQLMRLVPKRKKSKGK